MCPMGSLESSPFQATSQLHKGTVKTMFHGSFNMINSIYSHDFHSQLVFTRRLTKLSSKRQEGARYHDGKQQLSFSYRYSNLN